MSSLKDALVKAGLRPSKSENERERKTKWDKIKKSARHQDQRNYCESCNLVQPDVERYKHRNRTVDAQWICVSCADKLLIDDQYRVTAQSDFSKRKIFKREYGATQSITDKDFGRPSGRNQTKSFKKGPKR